MNQLTTMFTSRQRTRATRWTVCVMFVLLAASFLSACDKLGFKSGALDAALVMFSGVEAVSSSSDGYVISWSPGESDKGLSYSIYLQPISDSAQIPSGAALKEFLADDKRAGRIFPSTEPLAREYLRANKITGSSYIIPSAYIDADTDYFLQVTATDGDEEQKVVKGADRLLHFYRYKVEYEGCTSGTALDATRADIAFKFPDNAKSVSVMRNGVLVFQSFSSSMTSFVDSGLNEGETYQYVCAAQIDTAVVNGTQTVSVTTLSTNVPLFGGINKLDIKNGEITAAWALPSDGVAVKTVKIYAVAVDPEDAEPEMDWTTSVKDITATGAFTTSLNDVLGDDLTYLVGARACSAVGNCDNNTKTIKLSVPNLHAPRTLGAAGINVIDSKAVIDAPWKPTDGGIARRHVYVRLGTSGTFSLAETHSIATPWNVAQTLTLEYPLSELTTYQFYVVDEDVHGNLSAEGARHIVTLDVKDLTPPNFGGLVDLIHGTPADTSAIVKFVAIGAEPDDPAGATSYLIYTMGLAADAAGSACSHGDLRAVIPATAYTPGSTVNYTITGLSQRSKYSVCVKARDASMNISKNTEQSQIVMRDITPPAFGGASTATYSNSTNAVVINWKPSASSDLLEYSVKIFRGSRANPIDVQIFSFPHAVAVNGTSISSIMYPFNDNESVFVIVNACDNAEPTYGTKNCTNFANVSATEVQIPDISPPAGFAGISGVNQSAEGSATVSWHAPASYSGYRGFNVYHVNADESLTLIQNCACSANNCPSQETSCTVNVGSYRTYNFHVRAYDAAGNITSYAPLSPPSAAKVTIRTRDDTPPAFTSAIQKGIAPTHTISWNAATDNQYDAGSAITYLLYRKRGANFVTPTDPEAEVSDPNVKKVTVTSTTYTDSDVLVQGFNYYYAVCARDASNNTKCDGAVALRSVTDTTPPVIGTLSSDKTPATTSWTVSFTISDNQTAANDVGIKVYRSEAVTAEIPSLTAGNLIEDAPGVALGCGSGVCRVTGQTGPAGVTRKINYIVVATDAEGNSTTSAPLSIDWDDQPVTVTGVSRGVGHTSGGKLVVVTGTNFVAGATVKLNDVACGSVKVESSTMLSCISGASAAGTGAVVVTNADGRYNTAQSVVYTYTTTGSICDTPGSWGANYAGGNGTSMSPYLICNATHFNNMRLNLLAYYQLHDHIDLAGVTWTPIADFGGKLNGQVDGNGKPLYQIRSFSLASGGAMFTTAVANETVLQNLKLSFANVVGASFLMEGSSGSSFSGVNILNIIITNSTLIGLPGSTYTGGIVGRLNSAGTISNVLLTDSVTITSNALNPGTRFGAVIGYWMANANLNLSNITSYATVSTTATDVGGIAGYSGAGNCTNCRSYGAVSGNSNVGGLSGQQIGTGRWIKSGSYGNVTGAGGNVGGLIGHVNGGSSALALLQSTHAHGTVISTGSNVGGAIGYYSYTGSGAVSITDSYSSASVTGSNHVGGMVGSISNTGTGAITISRVYATGAVHADFATKGGLVGSVIDPNNGVLVSDSFWDTTTTGLATSALGSGKTTTEMQTQSTFSAFDFVVTPVWIMPTSGYPTLVGE